MISFEDVLNGLIRQVTVQWRDVLTDFMPLSDLMSHYDMIQYAGVNYRIDGGYDDAERVRLFMTMQDGELKRDDMNIHIISFSGNTKFIDFTHRDCLGALMGLGFERKCIGDIIVRDYGFDVLTNGEIDDYLLLSELNIKRVPMRAKRAELNDWLVPERKLKMISILVQQTRCDAIIAKAYNLSRNQAAEIIKAGLVQINHQVMMNPSKLCEIGQVIAARGYGKFVVDSIDGMSKKGKIKLTIGKYV